MDVMRFTMQADGRAIDLAGSDPIEIVRMIEYGRARLAESGATGRITFFCRDQSFNHPDDLMAQLFPGTFPSWRERITWDRPA